MRIRPWVPLFLAIMCLSTAAAARESRPPEGTEAVSLDRVTASAPIVASSPIAAPEEEAPIELKALEGDLDRSPPLPDRPGDQAEAVVQSIIEYSLLSKTISIIEEYRQLLQGLADIAEERFKAAKGSQHDVLMAQLLTLTLTGRKAEYEKRLSRSRSLINRLLSRAPDTRIEIIPLDSPPAGLSWSLEEIRELALKGSARRKCQAGNRFDPPAQNPSAEGVHTPSNFTYALEEAYSQAASAQQLMQLYQTSLIPLAGVTLESALGSYQAGPTPFQQLIDTVTISMDAQIDHCRATADYRKAIVRLETLTGLDLTAKKDHANAQ